MRTRQNKPNHTATQGGMLIPACVLRAPSIASDVLFLVLIKAFQVIKHVLIKIINSVLDSRTYHEILFLQDFSPFLRKKLFNPCRHIV